MNDIFIILTASLVAINAAVLGVFLVLRKMAMVGDAISHAVLPGIVMAYFFSGNKASVFLLVGATLSGVLATLVIDFFSRRARIQSDAAIGITYTLLFAIGMILISGFMEGNADIDQECVLYGDISMISFSKIFIDDNLYIGPRALYIELAATLVIFASIIVGFKGFKVLAFNEDYAKALGIRTGRLHYYLMGLVALVSVVSFEVVGAVLVVGFLIIPPATAQLITRKLKRMLMLACLFGMIAVVMGYLLAVWMDVSITGAMISVSGLLFGLVFVVQMRIKKQTALPRLPSQGIGS
jgi:manganese/zinc/iron transport system permease protein